MMRARRSRSAVTDPATLPDRYIVGIDGNCLDPALRHGTPVAIEKNGKVPLGDFAVLFFKPEQMSRPGSTRPSSSAW
jgi:hypothetical protein